ncbi:MAG TPA: carboxypeptidase-like regulatory domain-containing protein, partial [Bacteroidales bacterium]|nr:carboxypeptidase-like regulatory domain-containing protein [Bacteroidales bacterium]
MQKRFYYLKPFLLMAILMVSIDGFSQTTVQATVINASTKEALPYCNILVKGSNTGTITNADGLFRISLKTGN